MASMAMLGACAVGDRAEALFFRQQTVQSELADSIVRLETARPQVAQRLYGMEDELHEACAPLREAGQRKIFDETIDSDLEWAVIGALDTCEAKTQQAEHLVHGTTAGDDGASAPDLGTVGEDDPAR